VPSSSPPSTVDPKTDALAQARALLAATGQREDAAESCRRARSLDRVLKELRPDPEIRAAALVFPLLAAGVTDRQAIEAACGRETARRAEELVRLGEFGLPAHWSPDAPLPPEQAESLRKMLLAIVRDVRLVTVRLADQLQRMRAAKRAPEAVRQRVATESRVIFAPLANRLGIWHLKWELEDLAFRFLNKNTYMEIAAGLRARREEREARIDQVIKYLERQLAAAGIEASVQGRPKHIYSIWRKMQRKGVGLEQIFDASAVRVLVNSVTECYTVLGMVHGHWPYIPGEFDDYIANPKGNFYRSLHTAVLGPDDQPLEIQIRTHEMHEHAELGVAAHWRYKEGGGSSAAFDKKIKWLRQLLEPSDEPEADRDFIDQLSAEIFEDRVYAVTPNGDVVDLPAGSTPLDFAYSVHTDVGHHCRGAKVNGRMVPLTHRLTNGDKVEIITARNAHPSRDWLIPQRGYLASARSRTKVRAWFRKQDQDSNRRQGKAMLERELQRMGLEADLEKLADHFKLPSAAQLYLAVGAGDITLAAVVSAIERSRPAPDELTERPRGGRRPRPGQSSEGISVSGVGDLMTHMARCCRPVPPEPITGYITQGRGISVHRQDCRNLLRLQAEQPHRCVVVDWGGQMDAGFQADIRVEAYDRHGLLRDVSNMMTEEKVDIIASNTLTDRRTNTAVINMTVTINGLEQLSRVMHRISTLPNVYSVQRRR
jgi:GTP pyrophosphokinase